MERRPRSLEAICRSPQRDDVVWRLSCGHVAALTGWDVTPQGQLETPAGRHCESCRRSVPVVERTKLPYGERGPLDDLHLEQQPGGLWRWARYGRFGELIDVSEDFNNVGAARENAGSRNGDIPIR